ALAWAEPVSYGAGVRLVRLNPLGGSVGNQVTAFVPPDANNPNDVRAVVEVSLATGGGRAGLAWVQHRQRTSTDIQYRGGATHGSLASGKFAPPVDLGPMAVPVDPQSRGMVAAAAAPDGAISVLYRSTDGSCVEGEKGPECARFSIRGLGEAGNTPSRGVPLAVPTPCSAPIAGYLHSAGAWYFGICSLEKSKPVTTVYGIQFEPEYAHAEPILAGRFPAGMVPSPKGALVLGLGDGNRDAVSFTQGGREKTVLRKTAAASDCRDGRPVLQVRAAAGTSVELPLAEPMSRIEGILPLAIAPERARAVWTGKAVLVAFPLGQEVVLHRYECVAGDLERTDL
ncbi:MAG: hypothetical protein KC416_08610, partial [Myxococcales bacterium]|nr:hypothetical protein [Myxococcales bacterium]